MFPCANDPYEWKTFMSHGWLLSWLLQQRVYHCDGATDSTLKITSSDAQKYLQSKSYYYYHQNTSLVSKRASGCITLSYFFLSFYRETLQRKWIVHNTMSPNTFIALKSNKIKPKHIHNWCIFSNDTIVSIYYCWLEVLEVRSIFRIFNIYWMVCIHVVPITPFNVIIFIENTKSQM